MTIDELFGSFDKESHEWHEGLFIHHYREFSLQKDNKRKWILLDGPIDHNWVENLNSILDDNKRMSLPNGDSIKMADGMCILLETNHLKNVTPATVSRCGLIHLHRREMQSKVHIQQVVAEPPPKSAGVRAGS
jgi:dynein heavy chain, axonemal